MERAGKALTQARKKAGERLEQRIQKELRELDMEKVRFSVDFAAKEPGTDGCDTVRFLMSANAGEALRPISKIASGGEFGPHYAGTEKCAGRAGADRYAGF